MHTRKDLRRITGLPDKSLRYLLDRLDIQPTGSDRTFFGSPVFLYDDDALNQLHQYLFDRLRKREMHAAGKRCRGGCNRYLDPRLLNSQQICDHCRRRKWILNEATAQDPMHHKVDLSVLQDLGSILNDLSPEDPAA